MDFKPREFENKWVKKWEKEGIYKAIDGDKKPKNYILIEFPYPSGERLHVGHARSYCCLDAVARKRRMQGFNVLYPIGWDAFGLPAENYAIKTGIHPSITTKKNIANSKDEAISWGLSFDWDREINTTDPSYYKWTQWIFIQLFNKGLAYKQEVAVNWCPSCKINLANEEVIDGNCERCEAKTERRKQAQWLLRITAYADRLLDGLKTVNYREDIAKQQVNWIGKKEGAKVKFGEIEVFTTRIDTLFGVTYLVLAPEHELAQKIALNNPKVREYMNLAQNKSERERKQKGEKTGIDTGMKAVNPANGEEISIWVAEYVMMDIGTGAVMGVPAHDERDYEFAEMHKIPIVSVIQHEGAGVFEDEGVVENSGKYDGMRSEEARKQMIKDGLGELTYHYHLRDWVFSRQHYWGEPIPMINCDKCGWNPVPDDQLPVKLPKVEKYLPTDTGESPLAQIESFVNTSCPSCGGKAKRETDTMPNWAGSSWYYLRYIDPDNDGVLASPEKLKYWLPVDWYNGGMEHSTLHLLYSRFWHEFLFDIGVVPTPEPYAKRTSHGVILGSDGRKMSKSKGNVINPDKVVDKYGADTLRLYEMFIGPFDQTVAWSWESLEGTYRFLKRVWGLVSSRQEVEVSSGEAKNMIAKLVKKIESDLEAMKFNTAVAALMEFVNWWVEHKEELGKDMVEVFLKVLAPLAPFITEELYQEFDSGSVHSQTWPDIKVEDRVEKIKLAVQVDGKVRGIIESVGIEEEKNISKLALKLGNVQKYTNGKMYKVVYVPGKIINFVLLHNGEA